MTGLNVVALQPASAKQNKSNPIDFINHLSRFSASIASVNSLIRHAENFKYRDCFFLAFDAHGTETARFDLVRDMIVGFLTDKNLSRLGIGLQPRGQVDPIADDRVLHLAFRADGTGHRSPALTPMPMAIGGLPFFTRRALSSATWACIPTAVLMARSE